MFTVYYTCWYCIIICTVPTINAIYTSTTPTLSPTPAPSNPPKNLGSSAYCAGVSQNRLYILEVVQMFICFIGIIVTIYVSYDSCKHIPKMERLSVQIKYLFYSTIACTYIANIAALIQSAICLFSDIYENMLRSISIISFVVLILELLAILMKRLHSSFKNSTYALSTTHTTILIFMYLVIVFLCAFSVAEYTIVTLNYDGNWNKHEKELQYTTRIFKICMILSYILTSAYCITIFTIKLLKLTKLQMTSVLDVNALTVKGTHLSNVQKKLIQKTSKYIGLLTVAMSSTCVTATSWLLTNVLWDKNDNYGTLNSYLTEVVVLLTTFDSIVNIICLYLQFPFSNRYYNILCKCNQWLCQKVLTIYVEKSSNAKRFQNVPTRSTDVEDCTDEEGNDLIANQQKK
eukprot:107984_1